MSKNIIFVFSGTGNSLWAARTIARELPGCQVVTMGRNWEGILPKGYDSIGFLCPTYAGGVPKRVKEFIAHLDLQNNKNAYFFAVATCGRVSRAQNVITQIRHYLKQKGVRLQFGERLDMYSNYVVGYEMRKTVLEEAKQSAIDIQPMIESIKNHMTNKGTVLTPRHLESMGFMLIAGNMDKNFHVSDTCARCGICKKVCPVDNIEMNTAGKPHFMHHCEQCLACIQNCPVKSINYKDKTQNRGRYMHPDISWKELAALNGNTEKTEEDCIIQEMPI